MEIITGTSLSNLCDYSFGDHLGGLDPNHLPGGFIKPANASNTEFLVKCREFEGKIMTLFIDNIRLYNRPIEVEERDIPWVTYLLQYNDLLALCKTLTNNKFVIFCSHEDTPIDEHIEIPDNVLGIHAVNAEYFGGKIHIFPYGLQRQIGFDDHRLEIMQKTLYEKIEPQKLLYINCGIGRHPDRQYLVNFENLDWVTPRFDKDSKFFPYDKYRDFLDEMRNHKFMLCPRGHGMDCHRNWELLYLRRVPVMKDTPYFRELMKGWPVLFVDDWPQITRELLVASEHLYQEAQTMDINRLDLKRMFTEIVANYKDKC